MQPLTINHIFSKDILPVISQYLAVKDIKNLLVSKELCKVIRSSFLQVSDPEIVADIYKRLQQQPSKPLSKKNDFMRKFQREVSFEIFDEEQMDDLRDLLLCKMQDESRLFPNIDALNLDLESVDNLESTLIKLTSKIKCFDLINLELKYIISSAENFDGLHEELKALVYSLPTLKNFEQVITLRLRIDNSVFRIDNQLQNFIGHLNSLHLKISESGINFKAKYQIEVFIETDVIECIKEQVQELFHFPKEQANVCLFSPVNTLCKYINPNGNVISDLEEFASLLENIKDDLYWVNHLKLEYPMSNDVYREVYLQIIKVVEAVPNLKEIKLSSVIDLDLQDTIDDVADQWIAFRGLYEDFLSSLPDQVQCTANFQPCEGGDDSYIQCIGGLANDRYDLLIDKYKNVILDREKYELKIPKFNKELMKVCPRTFYFSGYGTALASSLNSIDYTEIENLSIHYQFDKSKNWDGHSIKDNLTHSLSRLKKLKKITIKPSFSFFMDICENAFFQIEHERILRQFHNYAREKNITFQVDLSGFAYILDEDKGLDIKDPTVRAARQSLVDINFSVLLEHIQKYTHN